MAFYRGVVCFARVLLFGFGECDCVFLGEWLECMYSGCQKVTSWLM